MENWFESYDQEWIFLQSIKNNKKNHWVKVAS